MARFDVVDATAQGYRFLWQQRRFIARIALLPMVFKFLSFFTVVTLGQEDNLLRQGLILLPAYFIDGIVICFLVRLALFQVERGQETVLKIENFFASSVMAAAVMFALIKLVLSAMTGVIYASSVGGGKDLATQEPNALMFVGAIFFLIFTFWAFRLLWAHIPVLLEISLLEYLKRLKGMMSSVFLGGTWIMCSLPFVVAIVVLADLLAALTGSNVQEPSNLYKFLLIGVQAVADLLVAIVTNVAIAYGIRAMMQGKKKDKGQD